MQLCIFVQLETNTLWQYFKHYTRKEETFPLIISLNTSSSAGRCWHTKLKATRLLRCCFFKHTGGKKNRLSGSISSNHRAAYCHSTHMQSK